MSQITKLGITNPGTITSISSGTGITLTPNPITSTGSVALTVPVTIANGGTNATAMSNTDGVVYFDGTKLATTTVGTSGQVLTSNGTGVAPTFQAVPASSISIAGDSGGALTGNSFTFTGGTTGLKFAGSGTTETLNGTLAIANGGTNATSYTQSNGIVAYNGTRLVNYAGPQLSNAGVFTNSSQPAFHAFQSTPLLNATGNGQIVTVPYDSVVFDNGGNFFPLLNAFIAPVTGIYMLGFSVYLNGIVAVNNSMTMSLVTDSGSYQVFCNPYAMQASGTGPFIQYYSSLVHLVAGNNCTVTVQVYNTTSGVNIQPGASYSYFWGYLVC